MKQAPHSFVQAAPQVTSVGMAYGPTKSHALTFGASVNPKPGIVIPSNWVKVIPTSAQWKAFGLTTNAAATWQMNVDGSDINTQVLSYQDAQAQRVLFLWQFVPTAQDRSEGRKFAVVMGKNGQSSLLDTAPIEYGLCLVKNLATDWAAVFRESKTESPNGFTKYLFGPTACKSDHDSIGGFLVCANALTKGAYFKILQPEIYRLPLGS